jgi:GNAT superfamily N-acetyltransferase
LSVRPARRADARAVAELWSTLVREHAALDPVFGLRAGAADDLPAAVTRLLDDPDAGVWVWDEAPGVAGFCAAQRRRAPAATRESQRIEITELVVCPSARRRGIGRALAEAALAWAAERGAPRVEVRVSARNPGGQGFWRSLGFGDFVDVLDRRL